MPHQSNTCLCKQIWGFIWYGFILSLELRDVAICRWCKRCCFCLGHGEIVHEKSEGRGLVVNGQHLVLASEVRCQLFERGRTCLRAVNALDVLRRRCVAL
eukprot:4098996-Amphidinium_carterae.1